MNKNKEKGLFKSIDLFAGLGGIRLAFEAYGVENVFSSEWDKFACDMYENYFGDRPHGDITKIDEKNIPDHHILLGGFPCQAFSIMGEKKGFDESRGTLFFDIARILKEKKPLSFMLENVKNLKSHDGGNTFSTISKILDDLGYDVHSKVLNALDFGLPQKRERIIIVGFRKELKAVFEFPVEPVVKRKSLEEVLFKDDLVDAKYFASKEIRRKRLEKCKSKEVPTIWHENKSKNVSALPYSCALRAGASHNYLLVNGKRRLTPRECMRLQGFPDDYKIIASDAQTKKMTGNSVPVAMIQAVAKNLVQSLEKAVLDYKGKKRDVRVLLSETCQ